LKSGHHHFIENGFGLKASSTPSTGPHIKFGPEIKIIQIIGSQLVFPGHGNGLLRADLGTSTAIGTTTQEIFEGPGLVGIGDFDQTGRTNISTTSAPDTFFHFHGNLAPESVLRGIRLRT
jgi:hypothetical protein